MNPQQMPQWPGVTGRGGQIPQPHQQPPTTQQIEGLIVLVVVAVLFLAWRYRSKWVPSRTAHGTAAFATEKQMRRAGIFRRGGLLLGRALEKGNPLLWLPPGVHRAIFARTGAGKGVSFLVPWMLGPWRGSRVIFEPKGEVLGKVRTRVEAMGRKIVVLDPFGTSCRGAFSFNPLDGVTGGGVDCIDEARSLSEAMVVRTGEEKDRHWDDQAANVITAILTYILVALRGPERCLGSLREIITTPGVYDACGDALSRMGGLYARLGGLMLTLQDKERASVLSVVNRHTTWLDSAPVLQATQSGWDARELLTDDVDLFITLPPHQLIAQSRWSRCVIAALLRMIGQHGMRGGRQCLMLLDEAGQLGHMQPLEEGLTLLRGAGLRMCFFFQSLGQLKECFREKESVFLDNVEPIFFGLNSLEGAKRVSEMLGNYTETAQSYSENWGSSRQVGGFGENQGVNYSDGSNVSVSCHARSLMSPDEILRLPDTVAIGFFHNLPPVIFKRVLYYSDPLFNRLHRLRKVGTRVALCLLVAALIAVLVSLFIPKGRGGVMWQSQTGSPDPSASRSTTWPGKR
jgi:type IV secretion system protein VirD4